MLNVIKFTGGFFFKETELELFKKEDRISIIYGKNGSGKSTISKAICRLKGDIIDDINQVAAYDKDGISQIDPQCIHVFNEDYIDSHIKIQEDGLGSIILFGELGDLEKDISKKQTEIKIESKTNTNLKILSSKFNDNTNKTSPFFYKKRILQKLSGEGNWAEREKLINNRKRNTSVNDKVMERIISSKPSDTLAILIMKKISKYFKK